MRGSHANFEMVRSDAASIVIRDVGPWDRHPTVTNDAEHVVSELRATLNGRRLLYFDSGGRLDEILVRDGRFAGFAPGPSRGL